MKRTFFSIIICSLSINALLGADITTCMKLADTRCKSEQANKRPSLQNSVDCIDILLPELQKQEGSQNKECIPLLEQMKIGIMKEISTEKICEKDIQSLCDKYKSNDYNETKKCWIEITRSEEKRKQLEPECQKALPQIPNPLGHFVFFKDCAQEFFDNCNKPINGLDINLCVKEIMTKQKDTLSKNCQKYVESEEAQSFIKRIPDAGKPSTWQ